jgi:regulator of RNase E activity RraA
MRNKGVAAFVTDGLARDKAGIVATGLPVFCRGIQPNSPAMNGPGIVGAPVTLGDVHVEPGDVIVGDANGVVVVPAHRLRIVLDRLAQVRAAEARTITLVEQGTTMTAGPMQLIEQALIVEG